jgi:RHS repeat-associated protein
VFFDNVQVVHTRGAILEETHYYPFGLTMSGISSKAMSFGAPQNKYKFNGIEQNNDFDLNILDAFYRNLDPQIGRFWEVDPVTTHWEGPYTAMQNNPILKSDPLGDYFTYGGDTKNTYNEMRKKNNEKLAGYIGEIVQTLVSGEKGKAIDKKIKSLTNAASMHAELNSQWNEMENSAVEFRLSNENPGMGSTTMGGTSFERGKVEIRLGKNEHNIMTMSHEVRHGYGYLNGELVAGDHGTYDAMDEVEATKVSYLFSSDQSQVNETLSGKVTYNYWYNLVKNGSAYKTIRDKNEQISVNTVAADYLKHNPGISLNLQLPYVLSIHKNDPNYTVKDAINDIRAKNPNSNLGYGEMLKRQ